MLTIPHHQFVPYLPPTVAWIKGQAEVGSADGYLHWQLVCLFKQKIRRGGVRQLFGPYHCELTRGPAANDYIWKEDTKVAGTEFELGEQPKKKNSKRDWESIWTAAANSDIESIPPDVRVRYYSAIKRIASDHLAPVAMERVVNGYYGPTGSGKSRRAWEEAGIDAFPKDPRTKFWDGYRGQTHVVIDEFRGGIDISHMLRWLDRYPVVVEVKGSSTVLKCEKIWITSNLHPQDWYCGLDSGTVLALLRRMNVVMIE